MENKRIGILTFHDADNYGAVLQAYALQHYIEVNISSDVEIIDFSNESTNSGFTLFQGSTHNPLKNFALNILEWFNRKNANQRHGLFEHFRKEYLHLTKTKYIGMDGIHSVCAKDVYISGSDQVFNPRTKNYRAYYLDFEKGDGRKIAYAPSFGISEFNDEITNSILPLLKDFDALCCREKSGAEYLSSILNRSIDPVLDPVFLLSMTEWSKILVAPKRAKRYLVLYCLAIGSLQKMKKLAYEICSQENLELVIIGKKTVSSANCSEVIVGPEEFIGYIKNADFILTDSFHGTSFSLILGKRHLSYIANKAKGDRIENVMSVYGKTNEIIHDIDNYQFEGVNIKDAKISSLDELEKSKEYLKQNI